MAEELGPQKPLITLEAPLPEPTLTVARKPRKRAPKLDRDAVVQHVLTGLKNDLEDRQERINRRLDRAAKVHGWDFEKATWPWEGAANFHVPIILIANLKMKATLENALKSQRPMLQAKSKQRENSAKETSIDQLLDYQFFIENGGEIKLDAFCHNFVEDEAVFVFTHYVREEQTIHDIRILDGLDLASDHIPQILQLIAQEVVVSNPMNANMADKDGWVWDIPYVDDQAVERVARVEFAERDDGKLEAHIAKKVRTVDGPYAEVLDFEDVVFPIRSGNLQPPSPANPYGAAYVNRICKGTLDSIRRAQLDGTYDLLDDDGYDRISAFASPVGSGGDEEAPKRAKDEAEGVQTAGRQEKRADRQIIEHYGRWDVNGDGLEEDVIVWIAREPNTDAGVLLKIAYLTEMYPVVPPKRPFAHTSFITNPNRVYGVSQSELLESVQDMSQKQMNDAINFGELKGMPFFFYRSSSGFKPEQIYVEPGEGIPVDDPQRDVAFPTLNGDTSHSLNMMALLQQFAERIQMFSDVSFGRVPTGKASALRTVGTTNALLTQSDSRAEQVLRRVFLVLSDVYQSFHALNKKFFPASKHFRVQGMPAQGTNAYADVSHEDIDADIDFEFKATMLNANKEVAGQNIERILAMSINQLFMMAGMVGPEELYNGVSDFCKALDVDPNRYFKRPPEADMGPKLLAEDVLSTIIDGQMPFGRPGEATAEIHMQKLQQLMQDPRMSLFDGKQQAMLQMWMQQVMMLIQREQMLMQAAGSFDSGGGEGGEGPGGAPTTVPNPDMVAGPQGGAQPNKPVDGAMMQ